MRLFVRLTPKSSVERIDGWDMDDKGRRFRGCVNLYLAKVNLASGAQAPGAFFFLVSEKVRSPTTIRFTELRFASLMVPLPDKRGGAVFCTSPLVGEGDRAASAAWWWGILL